MKHIQTLNTRDMAKSLQNGWLAMPQLVLQALWQEVWHSPQPPFSRLLAMSRVSRVWMCFIKQSPLYTF